MYQICGGRLIKYDKMKDRLLSYYKKQKIGSKSYWREELEKATPGLNETLDLFGMRLKELAGSAYPKSSKECAKQLRKQFLRQIPTKVAEKILDMEKAMKATSGGEQKHLNFAAIMQLAADLQPEVNRPHTIMWSDKVERHDFSVKNKKDSPTRGRQFWAQNNSRQRTSQHPEIMADEGSMSPPLHQWKPKGQKYSGHNRDLECQDSSGCQ